MFRVDSPANRSGCHGGNFTTSIHVVNRLQAYDHALAVFCENTTSQGQGQSQSLAELFREHDVTVELNRLAIVE